MILASRLPWPPDDGGRIAIWQNVRAASRAYDVTLVTLVPPPEVSAPLPPVFEEHGVRVIRVAHRPPSLLRAAWDGLFGPLPYTLARYRNAELSRLLRSVVAEARPAFVMATPLHMGTYADDLDRVPMILREHNLEHVWMARYARGRDFGPASLYARTQVSRLREAEVSIARRSALVLAVQNAEANALHALVPETRVETLPIGVDLNAYPEPRPEDPPIVLLAGSFAWPPNIDGAVRFVREGWPRVTARVPAARLRIVGKDMPQFIRLLGHQGAEVVGYVESMAEELARATVFVVPLWVGAGVRVKITEALAARVPIAATRIAAEGLGLEANKHFAAGDTGAELGEQVATLLLSPEVRDLYRTRGRAIAEEHWSLDAIADLQNKLCASV